MRDTTPTPVPPPSESPQIDFVAVTGYTVKLRLHNGESTSRAKPAGGTGATVFSYVGEALADWKFEGSVTRTSTDVTFPGTVVPGS